MRKSFFVIAVVLFSVVEAFAQTKIMQVVSIDGSVTEFAVEEIDRVCFTDDSGIKTVDLGLSVKWASCNVGASTPEEYGDFFSWGELSTKETYYPKNCSTYKQDISDYSGNAEYDVATATLGAEWRTPTAAEIDELIDNCTWEWTTTNGVDGYDVIGPNGNKIFLPATGDYAYDYYQFDKIHGSYWSSTPVQNSTTNSYYLLFEYETNTLKRYIDARFAGFTVRAVHDKD